VQKCQSLFPPRSHNIQHALGSALWSACSGGLAVAPLLPDVDVHRVFGVDVAATAKSGAPTWTQELRPLVGGVTLRSDLIQPMLRLAGIALTWRRFTKKNPRVAADLWKLRAEIARSEPQDHGTIARALTDAGLSPQHCDNARPPPQLALPTSHWLTGKVQFRRQFQSSKSPCSRQQAGTRPNKQKR